MKKLEDDALRLSNQLCFAIYSTAHALNRVYKPLLEPLGLTYPQYLVMLILWEKDDVSVKDIGARLYLDSGTLTPLLKRLEHAGLLTRRRGAQDERHVFVTLTSRGRSLRARAISVPHDILCATGNSVQEVLALRDELISLRQRLDAKTAP
ncbi:MAG: MarR family winged helix-turn-helix transcriptional regulator [Beijerinckiaceae bacterium]